MRHTIAEPLVAAEMPRTLAHRLADAIARRMGLTADILHRRRSAVSVGQTQRSAVARALAPRPSLLVLDEPLSALDAVVAHDVAHLLMETIDELRPTVLLVSHDLRIVRQMANRVVVVDSGRIIEGRTTAAFLDGPASNAGRALVASDRRRRAVFEAALGRAEGATTIALDRAS